MQDLNMPIQIFVAVILLELVGKSIALWKAARKGQKVWYFFLLIINSAGILPLIYLITEKLREPKQTAVK